MTPDYIRPIFVLGAPRSGTTLVGAFVGSHPEVAWLREYFAYYFSMHIAPNIFRRIPSRVKKPYLQQLRKHAARFAAEAASESGKRLFVDSTPFNLLIGSKIATMHPDAVFVLVIRRPEGVIESLRRSRAKGFNWAGRDDVERARTWASFYSEALALPQKRLVAFSYDRLCMEPELAIQTFEDALFNVLALRGFDRAVFSESYATDPGDKKRCVGSIEDGAVCFSSVQTASDLVDYGANADLVEQIVQPVWRQLESAFF